MADFQTPYIFFQWRHVVRLTESGLYVIFGIGVVALSTAIFAAEEYDYPIILNGVILGAIMAIVGLSGIRSSKEDGRVGPPDNSKSRSVAHILSIIPGMGHMYLGRFRTGLMILSPFAISIVLGVPALLLDAGTAVVFTAYSMTLLFFSALWSMIRICETCDDMDLPFEAGLFSAYYVGRTLLAERILFAAAFIALTSLSLLFLYLTYVEGIEALCTVLSLTVLPAYCVMRYRRGRKTWVRLKI
jgi:hypothetical protein